MTRTFWKSTISTFIVLLILGILIPSLISLKVRNEHKLWIRTSEWKVFSRNFFILLPTLPPVLPLPTPQPPYKPQMPDMSHNLFALHAAESHGLSSPIKDWIAQGAYDEDHCSISSYPPVEGVDCDFGINWGWHTWDPDTNRYWGWPLGNPFGSSLVRMNEHFLRAVDAYQLGDIRAAYLWLGRGLHLLGDSATPAHANLDEHMEGDKYELWLDVNELENTFGWISANPPGPTLDMDFRSIPAWEELNEDLKAQLDSAVQYYEGRDTGQELWETGPVDGDLILFQLMFLMAEEADNWDSQSRLDPVVSGERYHGDLDDPAYLTEMRNTVVPLLTRYSAALVDYFEFQVGADLYEVQLPLILSTP
jgi:hypothetical protein